MLFKHEEVKVLEPGAILTKIEDKEGREYWVKTADLKSKVTRTEQKNTLIMEEGQ